MGKLLSKSPISDTIVELTPAPIIDKKILIPTTIIRTAELPGVIFKLYDSADILLETKETGADGGEVEFSVAQTGTYKLYAYSGQTLLWSNTSIVVNEVGDIIIVPTAKNLNDYSWAEIHTACDKGFAHTMFGIGSIKTFVAAGSIYNNLKIFIENITTQGGKDYIDWRLANKLGTTYNIQPYIAWITSNTASSWTKNYRNYACGKYSAMQQRMKKAGEAVFSLATGILPDDFTGTLTTGIKFSDLKYTDGTSCAIFSYTSTTDTMTPLTAALMTDPSNNAIMLIEGYFDSVGTIDEPIFNSGVYYVYDGSNYVYTKATTYASGTTYYGLFKTMRADGVFVAGLADIEQYLVRRTVYASAGGTQTTKVVELNDYVNLPCIEEIFGVNRNTTLKSGTAATSVNAYNLDGEGSKLKVYDDWSYLCIGSEYWSRSTYSNYNSNFCSAYNTGSINTSYVGNPYGVRAGFRTC